MLTDWIECIALATTFVVLVTLIFGLGPAQDGGDR